MKPKIYKIQYGIKMKSYVPNPPIDIMNKLAVKRGSNAEVGPLDLFQIVNQHNDYVIEYDYDNESISMKPTTQKRKQNKLKNDFGDHLCKPLFIKNYKWHSAGKMSPNTKLKYGKIQGGNVFGDTGILSIHKKYSFQIPTVNALDCQKMLYDKFGVLLFHPGETLPRINVKNQTVYMVSYRINSHFAAEYVHAKGGPGIFLEHHNFPHFIVPLSQDAHGPVVIGSFQKKGDKSD